MKYIKTYEAYAEDPIGISREEIEKLYTPLINWNLVEDAKDMALEYLDKGMTLHLTVNNFTNTIYEVSFSHEKYQTQWYSMSDNDDMNREFIGYRIYLDTVTGVTGARIKIDESRELIARLKMAYPKYMIH